MPTPSDEPVCPPVLSDSLLARAVHTTCPPEEERAAVDNATRPLPIDGARDTSAPTVGFLDPRHTLASSSPQPLQDDDNYDSMRDNISPGSGSLLDAASKLLSARPSPPLPKGAASLPPRPAYTDFAPSRPNKHTSSFLRPGSVFKGTQQSDRQEYKVTVEVKHVDMAESSMCGYLTIQGLTQDHPTLTTYFEGEIIGTKYSFQTRRPDWGSNDKVDMQHWNRFPAWKPLAREARKPDFNYKDYAEREDIFMRWKEYFLVPDHSVRTISGASFEGFYYICFNQKKGSVSGIYFHSKSEKYQQLELKHVDDRGCVGAVEFR